jgi:hypothetical protein
VHLSLTGVGCVSRIYTDLAVSSADDRGVVARELSGTHLGRLHHLLDLPLMDGTRPSGGPDVLSNEPHHEPASRTVNGHLGVAQGLAAETAALSFDHIISLGAADRRAGRLAFTIPAEDPMPVWPQNAAILDGSPSPAAAKLFLRWLLEPDQQNAIAQGGAWTSRRRRIWRRWPSSTSQTDSSRSSPKLPSHRPTGAGSRHSSGRSPARNTAESHVQPRPHARRGRARLPRNRLAP